MMKLLLGLHLGKADKRTGKLRTVGLEIPWLFH